MNSHEITYVSNTGYTMFERFFERDTSGTVKGLTLEWQCPDCAGLNFRLLGRDDRNAGEYHAHCRYCKAKFHVRFERQEHPVEGEDAFMDRLDEEDFSGEEKADMIRDFAEITALRAEGALPKTILVKEKALELKIDFAKRRRR
ncbi:MAG: hypothetical protein M0Q92_01230 [Methanoregula sp.]|nr:hypothetical protein [Methanoregula sp.]